MHQATGSKQGGDSALDDLFRGPVLTGMAEPWMWNAEPRREEAAIVENAVGKRRREFAAGRVCARRMLRRFGLDANLVIGRDRNGAPLWPEGFTGSISHSDDACVVAIARQTLQLASLGLDVENAAGLDSDLVELVCDATEKAACRSGCAGGLNRLAKVIFSAKESAYKCLYPVIGRVLDFRDVHIELDVSRREFVATAAGGLDAEVGGRSCAGRVRYGRGRVYTGCRLAPSRTDC